MASAAAADRVATGAAKCGTKRAAAEGETESKRQRVVFIPSAMYDKTPFDDVALRSCDDAVFHVSKFVLGVRSSFFRSMIEASPAIKEIYMTESGGAVQEWLLSFHGKPGMSCSGTINRAYIHVIIEMYVKFDMNTDKLKSHAKAVLGRDFTQSISPAEKAEKIGTVINLIRTILKLPSIKEFRAIVDAYVKRKPPRQVLDSLPREYLYTLI